MVCVQDHWCAELPEAGPVGANGYACLQAIEGAQIDFICTDNIMHCVSIVQ